VSELGDQRQVVARIIAAGHQFGVNRQTFGVSLDGFDTHDSQAGSLPVLQKNRRGGSRFSCGDG
jgi:uncharacterized protein (DUF1501 family)